MTTTTPRRARYDQQREDRAYRLSEARWLMECGVHPVRICTQLDVAAGTLARNASDSGDRDLAAYIDRADRAVCQCGDPMSRGSELCTTCRRDLMRGVA